MTTIAFLLAILTLILAVVAAFVNRIDYVTAGLFILISLAVLLSGWPAVVQTRRVP